MRALLAVCVLAVAAATVAATGPATPPNYGNQFYLRASMSLPYAGIVEPLEAWYDGQAHVQRVDYYDGLDSYIFRGDKNVTWQTNPQATDGETSKETCVATQGAPDILPYIPDLTGFELQGDAVQINDRMCDSWQLTVTTLNKTSVYNFYVDRLSQHPVRYQMMGYDSLIGSHFDLYILDYYHFSQGVSWNTSIFDEPTMGCGSFPVPPSGPSSQGVHMNPLDEVRAYFPGGAVPEGMVSTEYASFLQQYGKSYGSVTEMREREIHFMRNVHFINSHQRKFRTGQATYTVGMNHMADAPPSEMAARRGRLPSKQGMTNNAMMYHQRNYLTQDLPAEVDWRTKGAVNPPQDQGICGSCWSFGSSGSIEGAYFLKYGVLKVLAEQELMDCSWDMGNNACDGGFDYLAFDWVMQNGGMSFKENYGPYLMADGWCTASLHSPDVVLKGYVNVTGWDADQNALLDAIASQGPISVSIDASHPGLSFYTGGVYYDPACGSGLDSLDHSVLAVGYGTDPMGGDYWLIKNSWSTYWGVDGYIKMSRKNNNCGVATCPTYVILQ